MNELVAEQRKSDRSGKRANTAESFTLKLIRRGFSLFAPVAPRLCGRIAYQLWITPPRFPAPQRERDSLAQGEQTMLDFDGQQIATCTWGSGDDKPGILLIHGWSGRGTQLASFVKPLLELGYRVTAFDAPAHGNSSGRQTNLYQVVDTILELDRRLGHYSAVITHSFGGPCLAVAMKHGLNTDCVVNISPPSTVIGLVDKFSATLRLPEKVHKELVKTIEQKFGQQVWEHASMANNIRDLDVPALVVHDVDDIDVPWHEGQAIAEAWSKMRFIKTTGLGHRRILKDDQTIRSVVDFIDEHTRANRAA